MRIREGEPEDQPGMFHLTRGEGWSFSEGDMEIIRGAGGICLVAEERGEVVGMATIVPYERYGWIGNVVVEGRMRNRGIGREMTSACVELLKGMGKVPALFSYRRSAGLYEKIGFVRAREYIRYRGRVQEPVEVSAAPVEDGSPYLDDVCRLDAELWGDDRSTLVSRLASSSDVLIQHGEGGTLTGYIMGSRSENGLLYIGPWASRSPGGARDLLVGLLARASLPEAPVDAEVSIPAWNVHATSLLDPLMRRVERVIEMYLGDAAWLRAGTYACASLDWG